MPWEVVKTGSNPGTHDIGGVQKGNISHYRREQPGVYRQVIFISAYQVVPLKNWFTNSHFLQMLTINKY